MQIQNYARLCLVAYSTGSVTSFLTGALRVSERPAAAATSPLKMASVSSPASVSTGWKVVPSIQHIVDDYDVFLLDMWGVMHDGIKPYDGVLDVVQRLCQDHNKQLIIVSNSSKRKENSVKMLAKLGFNTTNFAKIVTSGEVAYQLLRYLATEDSGRDASSWVPKTIPKPLLDLKASPNSRNVFCFGTGEGDQEYLEASGWILADSIANADLIVARGTFVIQDANTLVHKTTDGETAYFEAYHKTLQDAAQRGIPMIVSNPDKIRPDADKSPMPGAIGITYEELLKKNNLAAGDLVVYLGKPFADVYQISLQEYPGKRACMVGDALETDITGAQGAGIDSVWVVLKGVHDDEVAAKTSTTINAENKLERLESGCRQVANEFNLRSEETYAKGQSISPRFVVPYFKW